MYDELNDTTNKYFALTYHKSSEYPYFMQNMSKKNVHFSHSQNILSILL